jgi:hypothetical protein
MLLPVSGDLAPVQKRCNRMFRRSLLALVVLLWVPFSAFGQSVTLGGSLALASAEDFATRVLQDPWDMNDRTDVGWFLNGVDEPSPHLTGVSFSAGQFSATADAGANIFLLDSPNPNAARTGKTGGNYPIDANNYRFLAVRMNAGGPGAAALGWNRDNFWDGSFSSSNGINLTSGWRTYLINIPALGTGSGPLTWGGNPAGDASTGGILRSLMMFLSFVSPPTTVQIDWIRLVILNPALCRQVTWSGFSGAVDLYLVSGGQQTLLASGVTSNTASAGCSATGSGYNFFAGALAPGSYQVRAISGATSATSGNAYQINDAPVLTLTSPSEEGSSDDFATTQLGNPWDMNALSDVPVTFGITGQTIASIAAETPSGASLGNVNVYWATSTAGDPILAPLWENVGVKIDPSRYRILTVEYGLPNLPRSLVNGSVARVVWRVVGSPDSVSDDIIVDSRAGANVMNKLIVDMADRSVLAIEEGSPIGWVGQIDRFRFDPHEFSNPTSFFVRRIKLAAFEHATPGHPYTLSWTASKSVGTVNLYIDTDRDVSAGLTFIGSAPVSAGSFGWNPQGVPAGAYYVYAAVTDGVNSNGAYSRWPIVVDSAPPPAPGNFRIIN